MKYTHIKFEDAEKFYTVEDKPLTIVKVKTGRWLLTDPDGNVIHSATSQKSCVTVAEEFVVEQAKKSVNLNKLRFGKSITEETIEEYNHLVWGDVYEVQRVYMHDGHYWMADVVHIATGKVVENLRMDYFLNYMRVPAGTGTNDDVKAQLKLKRAA